MNRPRTAIARIDRVVAKITKADIAKIKAVAQDFMNMVLRRRREMGSLRDRAAAQAQMKTSIIDQMLAGMPAEFSSEDIDARAEVVFQHVQQQTRGAHLH